MKRSWVTQFSTSEHQLARQHLTKISGPPVQQTNGRSSNECIRATGQNHHKLAGAPSQVGWCCTGLWLSPHATRENSVLCIRTHTVIEPNTEKNTTYKPYANTTCQKEHTANALWGLLLTKQKLRSASSRRCDTDLTLEGPKQNRAHSNKNRCTNDATCTLCHIQCDKSP